MLIILYFYQDATRGYTGNILILETFHEYGLIERTGSCVFYDCI